jgi:hypothetical protein
MKWHAYPGAEVKWASNGYGRAQTITLQFSPDYNGKKCCGSTVRFGDGSTTCLAEASSFKWWYPPYTEEGTILCNTCYKKQYSVFAAAVTATDQPPPKSPISDHNARNYDDFWDPTTKCIDNIRLFLGLMWGMSFAAIAWWTTGDLLRIVPRGEEFVHRGIPALNWLKEIGWVINSLCSDQFWNFLFAVSTKID